MTPRKKAAPITTVPVPFTIVITIDNVVYQGEGITALDALKAVPLPATISTGTFAITHGEKHKEMLVPTMQMKRLLNPYNQEMLMNDIIFGL